MVVHVQTGVQVGSSAHSAEELALTDWHKKNCAAAVTMAWQCVFSVAFSP